MSSLVCELFLIKQGNHFFLRTQYKAGTVSILGHRHNKHSTGIVGGGIRFDMPAIYLLRLLCLCHDFTMPARLLLGLLNTYKVQLQ